MPELVDFFTKIKQNFEEAEASQKSAAYSQLSTSLEVVDEELREYIQEITAGQIKAVIKKLKSTKPITPEEKEQIKLWIIGDADFYLKHENNFDDWNVELKRLIGEIHNLKNGKMDIEGTLKVRALLRDAIRTVADIFYYVEQKERIQNFNTETKEIDESERTILSDILEKKLTSTLY